VAHPETQGLKPNSFEVDYVALKRWYKTVSSRPSAAA